MKNKTVMATIVIPLLVASLIAGMQIFKVAKANPIPNTFTNLNIDNPLNSTYISSTVYMSFRAEGIIWTNSQDMIRNFSFTYALDGTEPILVENITKVEDNIIDVNVFLYYYNFTGNVTLSNLANGNHNLTISQMVNSTYYNPNNQSLVTSNAQFVVNNPIITPSPTPTLLPTQTPTQTATLEPRQTPDRPKIGDFAPVIIPAIIIILAIVVVGLLAYFMKRRG